jgi:tetratricopeptide (TPR) repeat protein
MAIASSIVTYLAQEKGGAVSHDTPFATSAGNALITYLSYVKKMVWPTDFAVFYPLNPGGISAWWAVGAGLVLLAASIAVVREARRRPYLAAGWFWYLGTLVPVIGFVKIGQHAMADRYTYVPLIGLFVMVAWGVGDIAARWRLKKEALVVAAVAVFALLSAVTWREVGHWRNSITLFSHALEVTENNWLAHKNLATALAVEGNLREALHHVSESLRIKPKPDQYVSQAWLYSRLGQYENSLESCKKALSMEPDNERAHFLLGIDYVFLKDYSSALLEYALLKRSGSPFAPELLENLKRAGLAIPPVE